MSNRLGILGGMFDPVHNGHLEASRCAVKTLDLQRLHLVPCHIPNHRVAASSESSHRLAMLELAIADDDRLCVDPIEIERQRVSYTVETLAAIKAAHPDHALVFVLGLDAFNTLPDWHRWHDLFGLCHFFVLARGAASVSEHTAGELDLSRRRVGSAQALFDADSGRVLIAEDFQNALSSSQVRRLLGQNADVSGTLDPRVIAYIHQHRLYSEPAKAL